MKWSIGLVVGGLFFGGEDVSMWQCVKCHEQIEDSFDTCWRCGATKEGVEDPDFKGKQTGEFTAGKPMVIGSPLQPPSVPAATGQNGAGSHHLFASVLVWVLRGLALFALIWGLVNVSNASQSSRNASEALKHFQDFRGDEEQRTKAELAAKAVAKAASTAVLTAVMFAAALVAVLLALAEGLRLCILIEGNTRSAEKPQPRDQAKLRTR